eukprot:6028299-Pyramimonas_sp.AAC.1
MSYSAARWLRTTCVSANRPTNRNRPSENIPPTRENIPPARLRAATCKANRNRPSGENSLAPRSRGPLRGALLCAFQ